MSLYCKDTVCSMKHKADFHNVACTVTTVGNGVAENELAHD